MRHKTELDKYKDNINGIIAQLEDIKGMIDDQHLIINQNQILLNSFILSSSSLSMRRLK